MKKYFNIVFLILVAVVVFLFYKGGYTVIQQDNILKDNSEKKVIVLDPGHGGFDPGKVGINGVYEKDINLSIAEKLRICLEEKGIETIMTRNDDSALYSETDTNKKKADMKKRVEIINQDSVLLAISIHQNSFSQESSRGAQVFYHVNSEEGKNLATILQEKIKEYIKDENKRVAKSNDSYYMLKQTNCPLVIVECGFLSNYEEANLLSNEVYQEKIAQAICLGILDYLDISGNNNIIREKGKLTIY